jgi:hypothetical protein
LCANFRECSAPKENWSSRGIYQTALQAKLIENFGNSHCHLVHDLLFAASSPNKNIIELLSLSQDGNVLFVVPSEGYSKCS